MHERIEIDREIQHGKPVIKGTRIPVTRILAAVAGGVSFAEIEKEYGVSSEDIRAAVAFANELVSENSFHSTAGK
jgi:uncharacterized protein (DUF433 family)